MKMPKHLFYYLSGLGDIKEDTFEFDIDEQFLFLNNVKLKMFGKNEVIQQYKIKLEDIITADIVNTSELKKGSTIGRGAAGYLLFGPVGAVLGGMSAANKQKIKTTFAISYMPSVGDEPKTIVFNLDVPSWSSQNKMAVAKIKKPISDVKKSARVMEYLGQTASDDGSITL